jgi:hypothetical protein
MIVEKLKAFGWFWYDFIIGDDWTIAAGVVLILGATWLLDAADFGLTWLFLLVATMGLLYFCVRRGIRAGH